MKALSELAAMVEALEDRYKVCLDQVHMEFDMGLSVVYIQVTESDWVTMQVGRRAFGWVRGDDCRGDEIEIALVTNCGKLTVLPDDGDPDLDPVAEALLATLLGIAQRHAAGSVDAWLEANEARGE